MLQQYTLATTKVTRSTKYILTELSENETTSSIIIQKLQTQYVLINSNHNRVMIIFYPFHFITHASH